MILLDTNLLIYAYNVGAPQHDAARQWLLDLLNSPQQVRVAWASVIAFLRITTGTRALSRPMTMPEALRVADLLIGSPSVQVLQPSQRFWPIYRLLLEQTTASGNLTSDDYLAALAIDHGATFATHDRDFQRWQPFGLSVVYPLA